MTQPADRHFDQLPAPSRTRTNTLLDFGAGTDLRNLRTLAFLFGLPALTWIDARPERLSFAFTRTVREAAASDDGPYSDPVKI